MAHQGQVSVTETLSILLQLAESRCHRTSVLGGLTDDTADGLDSGCHQFDDAFPRRSANCHFRPRCRTPTRATGFAKCPRSILPKRLWARSSRGWDSCLNVGFEARTEVPPRVARPLQENGKSVRPVLVCCIRQDFFLERASPRNSMVWVCRVLPLVVGFAGVHSI